MVMVPWCRCGFHWLIEASHSRRGVGPESKPTPRTSRDDTSSRLRCTVPACMGTRNQNRSKASARLPQVMLSAAQSIADAVVRLGVRDPTVRVTPREALSGLDRPAVISIFGEPGSGKSTVLHRVSALLEQDAHRLVLPTLTPERFAEGDTLFGWTLAALQVDPMIDGTPASSIEVVNRGIARTLREHLDLLRRQEALAQSGIRASAHADALTPDELAIQLAAVTSSGFNLARGWFDLIAALTDGASQSKDAKQGKDAKPLSQLVVLLDDADRSPRALQGLLADLRWLTVHPAVAVVLCASEPTLLDVLAHASDFTVLSEPLRRSQADATLVKALPRHLRHAIRALSPAERLDYRTLDSDIPLRSVLARFSMPEPSPTGIKTLVDYFELHIGAGRQVSGYAAMLPGNARRLEQLARGLGALVQAPDRGTATGEAVRLIVEAALAEASAEDSLVPEETIVFTVEKVGPAVSLDLTGIQAGQVGGPGVNLFRDDGRLIGSRHHLGFSSNPENAPSSSYHFPEAFTYAHLFVQDVGRPGVLPSPVLAFSGMIGSTSKPGGSNWAATLSVDLKNEETDNRFLPIPDWENQIDAALYVAAWNAIVTWLEHWAPSVPPSDDLAVAWLVYTHIALVTDIQATRRVSKRLLPSPSVPNMPPWQDWSLAAARSRATQALKRNYTAREPTVRVSDFRDWVHIYLAWSADPTFAPMWLTEELLGLRASVIPRNSRKFADTLCAEALARRIQRHVNADWITGTIDLLERFDSARARDLRTLREIAQTQRSERDQSTLDALQERHVPESVLSRLALQGLTEPVAIELQAVGLPRQVIAQIAEQFPAATVTEPPTSLSAQVT
jgi:hypothetical protein